MTTEHSSEIDADRGDRIDDPSVASEIEEYQIVDPPLTDAEREIDEADSDPEAPLVSSAEDDLVDPPVDQLTIEDFSDVE